MVANRSGLLPEFGAPANERQVALIHAPVTCPFLTAAYSHFYWPLRNDFLIRSFTRSGFSRIIKCPASGTGSKV